MIAFRKNHEVLRHATAPSGFGFPDTSIHNSLAWNDKFNDHDHVIGVMFAGRDKKGREDAVFIGINSYWEECPIELPSLPEGYDWNIDFYTYAPYKKGTDYNALIYRSGNTYHVKPRSVIVASAISKQGLYR